MFIEVSVDTESYAGLVSTSEDLDGALPLADIPRSFEKYKFLSKYKPMRGPGDIIDSTRKCESTPPSPLQSPLLLSNKLSERPLERASQEKFYSGEEKTTQSRKDSATSSLTSFCNRVKVKLSPLPQPSSRERDESDGLRVEIRPLALKGFEDSCTNIKHLSPRAHSGRAGALSNQSHFSINLQNNSSAHFDGQSTEKRRGTARSYSNFSQEDRNGSRIDTLVDCQELLEKDDHFMEYIHNYTPQRERLMSQTSDFHPFMTSPQTVLPRVSLAQRGEANLRTSLTQFSPLNC